MGHVNTGSAGGLTGSQAKALADMHKLPKELSHLLDSGDFKPKPEYVTMTQNCALCTAAGVMRKLLGGTWTSGDVSADLGSPNETVDLFSHYSYNYEICTPETDFFTAQIAGVGNYIGYRCGATPIWSSLNGMPLYDAIRWMKGQEARCFAVWFQLHPNQGFCHWVYAEPVVQGILFTDYQVDHPELGGRPITGPLPMIGVLPSGSIATDVSTLIVIGFDK